jgi:DNA-binding transcriptional regulator YiaG
MDTDTRQTAARPPQRLPSQIGQVWLENGTLLIKINADELAAHTARAAQPPTQTAQVTQLRPRQPEHAVPDVLKAARAKTGISQTTAALDNGFPATTLQAWERGRHKPPEQKLAKLLAYYRRHGA